MSAETSRHVYIGSAWPYVNGDLHLGHIAALVPADFLARYHRTKGDKVLWTSGSDCHGTPITERARKEGCAPRDIAERFHASVRDTFEQFGFSYSLYWATMDPAHYTRVQESFLKLHEMGLIKEGEYHYARCAACNDARADREINGKCIICNAEGARGDQCNNCGTELNPTDLINPICSVCNGPIMFETSRELFLDLPALAERLAQWVDKQTHWRDNAKEWTKSWLKKGLKPRAISRKLDWGIPIPLPGWEDRRIYVWFEAVHGYLTASMQYAQTTGKPDGWKPFWFPTPEIDKVLAYYVIGKDNIPFHTLMWPAILMAHGLVLPWHIVSSEYLGLEGKPLSTSKNWAIWAPDYLSRHDPDYLRYFLAACGPEKQDTDFSWQKFVQVVNGEIINNYGNLVQRMFSFTAKRFDGKVPEILEPDKADKKMMVLVHATFELVGALIERTEFRKATECVMTLVQATNRYVSAKAPWVQIKSDTAKAGTSVAVAINVIAALSILTEPFMPFQAQRLREMIRLPEELKYWSIPTLPAGHQLGEIKPLFAKLDESVVTDELARLKAQSAA